MGRPILAPFRGAACRRFVFPGVRQQRVPLANFLSPLRGGDPTPKGCGEISQGLSERSERNPWCSETN
jgi:hypothetical protein